MDTCSESATTPDSSQNSPVLNGFRLTEYKSTKRGLLMRTLTSGQSRIAMHAVWLVVFLVLSLAWFMIGQEDQLWAVAIYAAVVGVATYLTVKISPYQTMDDYAGQDSERRI